MCSSIPTWWMTFGASGAWFIALLYGCFSTAKVAVKNQQMLLQKKNYTIGRVHRSDWIGWRLQKAFTHRKSWEPRQSLILTEAYILNSAKLIFCTSLNYSCWKRSKYCWIQHINGMHIISYHYFPCPRIHRQTRLDETSRTRYRC